MLYVGFGSFGDTDPFHGWVIASMPPISSK